MKNVNEYKLSDCMDSIHHAKLLAMSVIENIYHRNQEEERPSSDDIHDVKRAMCILNIANKLKL